MHVPLDLMMLTKNAARRHSASAFFSPPSQFFCEKFAHGTCAYGSACNKRRAPYAEVCCTDWLVHGSCPAGKACEFYHREPEGEPLSHLTRIPTHEEFLTAARAQRRVKHGPEEDICYSRYWCLNLDKYTFLSGPPNKYIRCGLTCGTRSTGTPWVRSARNDASGRKFREQ